MLKGETIKEQIRSWQQHKQVKPSEVLAGDGGKDASERARKFFLATQRHLDELEHRLLSEHSIAYDWSSGGIRPYDDHRGRLLEIDAATNQPFDPTTGEVVDAVSIGWELPKRPTREQIAKHTEKADALILFARVRQGFYAMLDCGQNAVDEGRPFEAGIAEGLDAYYAEDFPREIVAVETLQRRERGIDVLTSWVAANSNLGAGGNARLGRLLQHEYSNVQRGLLEELPAAVAPALLEWLDSEGGTALDLGDIRTKATNSIEKGLREVRGTGAELDPDAFRQAMPGDEDALARVLRTEEHEAIRRQLTERQLAIMEREADGFTYEETARKLGIAVGTVAATISQVREKMSTPLANRKKKGRPKKS